MAHTVLSDPDVLQIRFFTETLELKDDAGTLRARPLHGQVYGADEDPQQLCDTFAALLAWFAQQGVVPSP